MLLPQKGVKLGREGGEFEEIIGQNYHHCGVNIILITRIRV